MLSAVPYVRGEKSKGGHAPDDKFLKTKLKFYFSLLIDNNLKKDLLVIN